MTEQPRALHTEADLARLSTWRLERLLRAADVVLRYTELMGASGTNPVAQVLRGSDSFTEGDHYPAGDAYDAATGSQYYYHAHRAHAAENGHFHIFVRAQGMPARLRPALPSSQAKRPTGSEAIAHLVAISIGPDGLPVKLFATNQWVTDETFYSAADTARLLDRFKVEHTQPCLATNRWITAVVQLFRPQIEALLKQRDIRLHAWQAAHPDGEALTAPDLEVLAEMPIDIDHQIRDLDEEMERRRGLHCHEIASDHPINETFRSNAPKKQMDRE